MFRTHFLSLLLPSVIVLLAFGCGRRIEHIAVDEIARAADDASAGDVTPIRWTANDWAQWRG
ncbi:MAG: hypothetical protein AAFN70_20770, partial [Planctomycetota bacterium]